MSEKKAASVTKLRVGMNLQTAEYVNTQHNKIGLREKSLIAIAIDIGSILYAVQKKCDHGVFLKWLSENVSFCHKTAYKYIALFNFKDEVSGLENLIQAYRKIDAITKPKKEKERKVADKRVEVYNKTGKKPKGWRRGTDDKLAKEKSTGVVKKKDVKEAATKKPKGWKKNTDDKLAKEKSTGATKNKKTKEAITKETGSKEDQQPEKEKQGGQENDIYDELVLNFIKGLPNNGSKIIACQNIIKMCRKIIFDLQ